MALSPAEKMRAYRERQKANNQKPVSFLIDADIAETVTSYAEQHQTTQADVFNNLLRQALSGNKLPNSDTVTSYQKEIDQLNAELDRYKAGNTKLVEQRDNERNQVIQLQTELRTAKTEPAKLKAELSAVKRELSKQQTRFCQCLTAAGHQCTKPATHENKHNGFILWTCEQHYQSVINAN